MKRRDSVMRLKSVLIKDKSELPEGFSDVIKSDVFRLLLSYADLTCEEVSCKVGVNDDGDYEFKIVAKAKRLKNMPVLI